MPTNIDFNLGMSIVSCPKVCSVEIDFLPCKALLDCCQYHFFPDINTVLPIICCSTSAGISDNV
jgi:hypothetical protein